MVACLVTVQQTPLQAAPTLEDAEQAWVTLKLDKAAGLYEKIVAASRVT